VTTIPWKLSIDTTLLETMKVRSTLAILALLATLPKTLAVTYDVGRDFSTETNPGGVWSYGYSVELSGPLTLFTQTAAPDFPLRQWLEDLSLRAPSVANNPTEATLELGTGIFPPGKTTLHPGPGGEHCVIRFTAPFKGVYQISGSFEGNDVVGTTTDVHLLVRDVPVFEDAVTGFGSESARPFNHSAHLEVGDHVTFSVGFGNGSFYYDSTILDARLEIQLDPPTIDQHPATQSVARGGSATFSTTATGEGPFTYQWFFGEDLIEGATGSTHVVDPVDESRVGSYHVVVRNASGATPSNPAILTLLVAPVIEAPPASQVVRPGADVVFSAPHSGTPPFTYQWRKNGDDLPGRTGATLALPAVDASNVGHYSVVVRNGAGQAESANASLSLLEIEVYPGLIISGPVGARYRVEFRTDIDSPSWTALGETTLDASPKFYFDTTAPARDKRFYRAVPLP